MDSIFSESRIFSQRGFGPSLLDVRWVTRATLLTPCVLRHNCETKKERELLQTNCECGLRSEQTCIVDVIIFDDMLHIVFERVFTILVHRLMKKHSNRLRTITQT